MIFVLVVLALILALYWTFRDNRKKRDPVVTVAGGKKRVSFNPVVTVANAGGKKSDRYNPDLRDCVKRNASLAQSVGGIKQLILMDEEKGVIGSKKKSLK